MFITDKPIRLEDFLERKPSPSCGAVASFVGVVRNHHQGKSVSRIYYDCYPTMAEKEIQRVIEEIKRETGVTEIRVVHRMGWVAVGEAAVAVVVTASHRDEVFTACRKVIDEIKKRVPIWKKEIYIDGASEWVICENTGSCLSRREEPPVWIG